MTDLTKWINIINEGVEAKKEEIVAEEVCDCKEYDCEECYPAKNESLEVTDEELEETYFVGEDSYSKKEPAVGYGTKDKEPTYEADEKFDDPCPRCDGIGMNPDSYEDCFICLGTGQNTGADDGPTHGDAIGVDDLDYPVEETGKTRSDRDLDWDDYFDNDREAGGITKEETEDDYPEPPSTDGYEFSEIEPDVYDDRDYDRVKGSLDETDKEDDGYPEPPSTDGYDVDELETDDYDDSDYERVKHTLEATASESQKSLRESKRPLKEAADPTILKHLKTLLG